MQWFAAHSIECRKVLELDLSSSKMPVSPSSVKGSNLAGSASLLGA